MRDLFESPTEIFDKPKVEKLFVIKTLEIVTRLKWNISGTCFAGSSEDGTITMW